MLDTPTLLLLLILQICDFTCWPSVIIGHKLGGLWPIMTSLQGRPLKEENWDTANNIFRRQVKSKQILNESNLSRSPWIYFIPIQFHSAYTKISNISQDFKICKNVQREKYDTCPRSSSLVFTEEITGFFLFVFFFLLVIDRMYIKSH